MPIYLESGFFWDHLKDSIDQVTIIHQQDIHITELTNSDFIKHLHKSFVGDVQAEIWISNDASLFDTTIFMDNKWVSLCTMQHYDSATKLYNKAVAGAIPIQGNVIKIIFSLLTKQKDTITDKFIERSKQMMMKMFEQNGI
jgi:hypothetical protein